MRRSCESRHPAPPVVSGCGGPGVKIQRYGPREKGVGSFSELKLTCHVTWSSQSWESPTYIHIRTFFFLNQYSQHFCNCPKVGVIQMSSASHGHHTMGYHWTMDEGYTCVQCAWTSERMLRGQTDRRGHACDSSDIKLPEQTNV